MLSRRRLDQSYFDITGSLASRSDGEPNPSSRLISNTIYLGAEAVETESAGTPNASQCSISLPSFTRNMLKMMVSLGFPSESVMLRDVT